MRGRRLEARRGAGPGSGENVVHPVSGLQAATTYYWKVVTRDDRGGVSESQTWRFTTVR